MKSQVNGVTAHTAVRPLIICPVREAGLHIGPYRAVVSVLLRQRTASCGPLAPVDPPGQEGVALPGGARRIGYPSSWVSSGFFGIVDLLGGDDVVEEFNGRGE